MKKILLTSTIPLSLNIFCKGWLAELERSGYRVVAVSSPGDDLEELAEREGVKTYAVPMCRYIAPLNDLRSLWQLIKVFRRERPHMVHSITPKAGLLSMLAAWLVRVPIRVHTFTGLVFPTARGLRRAILQTTDRLTAACATHIVPEGEGIKADLQRNGITRKPLRVLGYGNVRGIDLEYYNPDDPEVKTQALALRDVALFTFIFVGRMVGDKGVNELVAAFCRLHRDYPATRLLLVGWEAEVDPLTQETEEEICRNSAITCAGYQSDVRPWLAAADVLVLPSYREGFPNVVIEAGAMGLPSIVSNVNGANEIVIEGRNGLIVPPRDVQRLGEAMVDMMENRVRFDEMRRHARPMISERYEQFYVRCCQKAYYREILQT